jgi:hypothetical protein
MTVEDIFYLEPVQIGQNKEIKILNVFFKRVENFKYLGNYSNI